MPKTHRSLKTVRVLVRSTTSRKPFRPGTYSALLGTSRGHDTWARAAGAALKLADRRGYLVTNRELVERRIASEAS
jgi:hypothetical protein